MSIKKFEFTSVASYNFKVSEDVNNSENVSFSENDNYVKDGYLENFKANSGFTNYEDQANKIEELFLELLELKKYDEIKNICTLNHQFWTHLVNYADYITLYRTAVSYNGYLKMYGVLADLFKDRFGIKNGDLFLKITRKEYINLLRERLNTLDVNSIKRSRIVALLSNLKQSIENKIQLENEKNKEERFDYIWNKESALQNFEFETQETPQINAIQINDQDSLGGASFEASTKYSYLRNQDPKKIASMLSSKNFTYKKASEFLKKAGFISTKQSLILKEFSLINIFKKDICKKQSSLKSSKVHGSYIEFK